MSSQYGCQECSKSFKRQYDLETHTRIHTKEAPFKCSLCPKSFTQKGNMNRHYNAVHSVEEYNQVNKAQINRIMLHEKQVDSGDIIANPIQPQKNKINALDKPIKEKYKCDFKNCLKEYKYKHDLNIHKKKHEGEDKYDYECKKCEKKYYRFQSFNYHVKNCKKGLDELVQGESVKEEDMTEEEKKQHEKNKRQKVRDEDREIENEAKKEAKKDELEKNQKGVQENRDMVEGIQINEAEGEGEEEEKIEENEEARRNREIQENLDHQEMRLREPIKCEHEEGCKNSFDTLKQYFRHHSYYFAYCREDKKRLKFEIRTFKDLLKKKNGLIKVLQKEVKDTKEQLKPFMQESESENDE